MPQMPSKKYLVSSDDQAENLAHIFESVSEMATYDAGRSRIYSRTGLRALTDSDTQHGHMNAALAQAKIPTQELQRILPVFRNLLGEFVDKKTDRIGNGLVGLAGGVPEPTLSEYVHMLIRAAAVLGGERTADLLFGWIQGEPMSYKVVSVLNGIAVDQPLTLMEGLQLYQLPLSSDAIVAHLPPMSIGFHGINSVMGRVVLSIECEAAPALYCPSEGETNLNNLNHIWAGGRINSLSVDSFCEAMSLSCNGCIRWKFLWRDFGILREFLRVPSGMSWTNAPQFGGATNFSQEQFECARKIHNVRSTKENSKPNLNIAISRWIKSKSYNSPFTDQLIDLRIALEALYLNNIEGELRFRLASHGAWHVSQNADERKRNFQTLIQVYKLTSSAVHGSNVKKNDKNEKLLENAQDICRKGILMRLEERTEPKWNDLIMGD